MTAAGFTDWWVRTYTRGLPVEVATSRRAEIENDVHEHLADGAPGAAVVSRTARGAISDLTWRRQEARAMKAQATGGRPTGFAAAWSTVTQSWFTPIAVLVGLFDVLGAIAVASEADGKMPGRVIGPIILSTVGLAMFTGLWLRWSARYEPPTATPLTTAERARHGTSVTVFAALGVAALVIGIIGSIIALGVGVVILGGVAVAAVRRRSPQPAGAHNRLRRLAIADVLIIIGVLPALAFFWMVIPPVLALIVIGGVIGTGARVREQPAF